MKKSMKRLVPIITLLFSFNAMGMNVLGKRVGSIKTYNPNTFGRTHFIRGYSAPTQLPTKLSKKEKIIIDQRPPIIEGSSVHLIDESRKSQAFFSYIHNITSIIIEVINAATSILEIAAFTLTHPKITDAIIAARNKGVDVSVIMDSGKMKDPYSKAQKLIDNDISVWQYDPMLRPNYKKKNGYEPLMHHKIILTEKRAITGSANPTKAAETDNMENIILTKDPLLVEEYRREMKRLKSSCRECKKDVPAKS